MKEKSKAIQTTKADRIQHHQTSSPTNAKGSSLEIQFHFKHKQSGMSCEFRAKHVKLTYFLKIIQKRESSNQGSWTYSFLCQELRF